MIRYNRTNFTSARVVSNIVQAMAAVALNGLPQYIEDRKGERWLRVALKFIEGQLSFEFFARNGQEVGDVILSASFDWHEDDLKDFSALLVKVYTMTELPATESRPTAPKEIAEAVVETMPAGATHSLRSSSGHTLYGFVQRSWLGLKKRFVVLGERRLGRTDIKPCRYELHPESLNYYTMQGVAAL